MLEKKMKRSGKGTRLKGLVKTVTVDFVKCIIQPCDYISSSSCAICNTQNIVNEKPKKIRGVKQLHIAGIIDFHFCNRIPMY